MWKKISDALGLTGAPVDDASEQSSAAVAAIAQRLDGVPPERARLVAALAMVLARAARADLEASSDEMSLIAATLQQYAGLSGEQADLVTEMVSHRNQLFGVSEDYLATREFRRLATPNELDCILKCLFAVCAADDSISLVEEEEVRQVASELGLGHQEFVAARAEFREHREVLKGLRTS
jgi:uncharacterized tellurite resistance protein B-like protein